MSSFRLATICVDCNDRACHGGVLQPTSRMGGHLSESEWVLVRDPPGGTGLSFQAESGYREPTWPEQEMGQDKMLRLDIQVDDLDAAAEHAIVLGSNVSLTTNLRTMCG